MIPFISLFTNYPVPILPLSLTVQYNVHEVDEVHVWTPSSHCPQ